MDRRSELKAAAVVVCLLSELLTFASIVGALRPPEMRDLRPRVHHQRNWTFLPEKHEKIPTNYTVKDVQLGCKELRSKKYISDGYCTSVKPVTEVVCAGMCLPVADLPWYAELVERRSYRNAAAQWRCVNDHVTRERVHLVCHDGTKRSYKIRVVRSCRCRKARKSHNDL